MAAPTLSEIVLDLKALFALNKSEIQLARPRKATTTQLKTP